MKNSSKIEQFVLFFLHIYYLSFDIGKCEFQLPSKSRSNLLQNLGSVFFLIN